MPTPKGSKGNTHSMKLILEAIDEYGPMTVAQMVPVIGHHYEWIRLQARAAVDLGYLISYELARPMGGRNNGGGRPLIAFSRTSTEVSKLSFKPGDPAKTRARARKDFEEIPRQPTIVNVRRDPFDVHFFGPYEPFDAQFFGPDVAEAA
jgi:hypothetical protein